MNNDRKVNVVDTPYQIGGQCLRGTHLHGSIGGKGHTNTRVIILGGYDLY